MGDRETLIALAERVEKAGGADYEIDLAIATWCYRNGAVAGVKYDPALWLERNGGEFTSSVDDALMLVNGDEFWRVGHNHDDPSHFTAQVSYSQPPSVVGFVIADGGTPALALTAAALRARAETQEPRHD